MQVERLETCIWKQGVLHKLHHWNQILKYSLYYIQIYSPDGSQVSQRDGQYCSGDREVSEKALEGREEGEGRNGSDWWVLSWTVTSAGLRRPLPKRHGVWRRLEASAPPIPAPSPSA